MFYHCLNSRNEEVFGQKKNPRYLPQNISLDDEGILTANAVCNTIGGEAIHLGIDTYCSTFACLCLDMVPI